jgi:AAA domain, putative AbiEii toxin, Type IV TA system/AAA ATPase domain
VAFTSVKFQNFKGLANYRLTLRHMNVLVGPNNAGKSTVVGAFRALAAGIRSARARAPERWEVGDKIVLCWRLAESTLPISIENVHTNYADVEASVTFHLSNGNRLRLVFPPQAREGFLIPEASDHFIGTSAAFKRSFPVTLGIVPVLGPVEHNEDVVESTTVGTFLSTHRASRHFRSYWFHHPEDFELFRTRVRATWPGMDIDPPLRADPMGSRLMMLCKEDGLARELYWSGSGFQVWCQTLTHLLRAEETSLIVVDEPEIYLHPDLQRQLLTMLRDLGPDVLLATHSSEIVAESEPHEVIIVDKARRSGDRVSSQSGLRAALTALGSIQNVVLTRLARTRRVIFVEGEDYKYLARFAARLGYAELAAQAGVTVAPLGSFPSSPGQVIAILTGMEEALGQKVLATCLFDRDYRSDEEVAAFEAELAKRLSKPRLSRRKELENYLLNPVAVDRALERALVEQKKRTGAAMTRMPLGAAKLLERITEPHRHDVQAQWVAHRIRAERKRGRDEATTTASATRAFEEEWHDLERRLWLGAR